MSEAAQAFDNPRDRHLFDKRYPKQILALDGGGVRGAVSVAFLERIEKILSDEHNRPVPPSGENPQPAVASVPAKTVRLGEHFDLVGGTSTGAIIACALALGHTTAEIKDFYLRLAPRVFKKPHWRIPGLQAKFDARALVDEINGIVKDRTLDSPDLITGLGIISKRLDTGSPWILVNNKEAPYWHDELPTKDKKGHIGNKHYRLSTLIRASTAAPHYFDPEILAITEDAPHDPLGEVKANLSGWPLISLALSKARALYGMVSKDGPSADTHGIFVDGGVTPHNNPTLALLMMMTLKPLGICWPLGSDKLTIISIGTGSCRTRVTFKEIGFAGPLRLAVGALLSMMADTQYQALAQMQWLGECMTCWTVNSELHTLCGERPHGGHWFRFGRYDVRLEGPWLRNNLGIQLSDDEVARLQGMDDPGIIETLYGIARLAAEKQVKREHFFPDANNGAAAIPFCEKKPRDGCPRFIGP